MSMWWRSRVTLNTEHRAYRRCQFQTNKPTKVDICEHIDIWPGYWYICIWLIWHSRWAQSLHTTTLPPVHFEQHIKSGFECQLKAVSGCLDLRAALQPCRLNGHPSTTHQSATHLQAELHFVTMQKQPDRIPTPTAHCPLPTALSSLWLFVNESVS